MVEKRDMKHFEVDLYFFSYVRVLFFSGDSCLRTFLYIHESCTRKRGYFISLSFCHVLLCFINQPLSLPPKWWGKKAGATCARGNSVYICRKTLFRNLILFDTIMCDTIEKYEFSAVVFISCFMQITNLETIEKFEKSIHFLLPTGIWRKFYVDEWIERMKLEFILFPVIMSNRGRKKKLIVTLHALPKVRGESGFEYRALEKCRC